MEYEVLAKIQLKKELPGMEDIHFGKYTIRSVPSGTKLFAEATLEFKNTYGHEPGDGSDPVKEVAIACDLLSLVFATEVVPIEVRMSSGSLIQNPQIKKAYNDFYGMIGDVSFTDTAFTTVLKMPEDLARQFSRASRAYAHGIGYITKDVTFSFLLFTVAIECLSSQQLVIPAEELHPDEKKCERFCTFIMRYFPENLKGDDEKNEELFKELLKTVYYVHRSAFIHGGREVSHASVIADCQNSSYCRHQTSGKEEKTPGLKWFANVVRGALLGYLENWHNRVDAQLDGELLSKIAFEGAKLKLKAKRSVQAGEPVSNEDIEIR